MLPYAPATVDSTAYTAPAANRGQFPAHNAHLQTSSPAYPYNVLKQNAPNEVIEPAKVRRRTFLWSVLERCGCKHVEFSYSSTLLFVWFILLSVRVQFLSKTLLSLSLCAVALRRSHGESRLLMPLLFLSELCLYNTRQQPRTPLYFYASVVFALVTFTPQPPRWRVGLGRARQSMRSVVRVMLRRSLCECFPLLATMCAVVAFLCLAVNLMNVFLSGPEHAPLLTVARENSAAGLVRSAGVHANTSCTTETVWQGFGACLYVLVGYVCYWRLHALLSENEAVLVSSWVGFIFCDICISRDLRAEGGRVLGGRDSYSGQAMTTSRTHVAGRAMIIYTVLLMSVLSVASKWCKKLSIANSKSSSRRLSQTRMTIVFVVAFVVLGVATERVVSFHFRHDALMWLYDFLASSLFRRSMLAVWLVGIPVIIVVGDYISQGVRKTVRRKFFHLIAVIAFTPAALYDPPFLAFALMTAASLSSMVELGRHFNVYGAQTVTYFTSQYIDDRDSIDGVVRTHIYLIFGLGVSIFIHNRFHEADYLAHTSSVPGSTVLGGNTTLPTHASTTSPVLSLLELCVNVIPGITALGVVDSSAAIIGSTFFLSYRRVLGRYLKNAVFTERANVCITHKTTTGTAGGLLFGILFWFAILLIDGVYLTLVTWSTFSLIAVCTLTECFMDGVDNLQMPLVTLTAVYSLFTILL